MSHTTRRTKNMNSLSTLRPNKLRFVCNNEIGPLFLVYGEWPRKLNDLIKRGIMYVTQKGTVVTDGCNHERCDRFSAFSLSSKQHAA